MLVVPGGELIKTLCSVNDLWIKTCGGHLMDVTEAIVHKTFEHVESSISVFIFMEIIYFKHLLTKRNFFSNETNSAAWMEICWNDFPSVFDMWELNVLSLIERPRWFTLDAHWLRKNTIHLTAEAFLPPLLQSLIKIVISNQGFLVYFPLQYWPKKLDALAPNLSGFVELVLVQIKSEKKHDPQRIHAFSFTGKLVTFSG